ncbi:hypothetical protein [Mycetocola miduiensis]|uniref:hypothetical protein n=1 Tax=Mycetocola miduiensis TaxID=995034 RepID=UPI000B87B9F7|nr:hypothetical protein [Mycetocola miduiensis]
MPLDQRTTCSSSTTHRTNGWGRIRELISRKEYAAAATAIGEQIATEDGTGAAVEALQSIEAAFAARRLAPNP